MKQDGLQRMLDFLALPSAKGIEFRIEQQAPDELMVAFALVGVRVEVVFSVARMQFSYFKGNEDVLFDEKVLLDVIKENWDE